MANQNIQLKDQNENQLFPRTKWKNIVDAPKTLPNPGTLTINGQDYDGTTNVEVIIKGESGSGETTFDSKIELVTTLPTPEASLRGKIVLLWDKATQSDNVVICTIKNGIYVWSSLIDGILVDSTVTEDSTVITSGTSNNN